MAPTYAAAVTRTGVTLQAMGFNPFRKQDKSALDIALVAGFVLLTLVVVAWGFLG